MRFLLVPAIIACVGASSCGKKGGKRYGDDKIAGMGDDKLDGGLGKDDLGSDDKGTDAENDFKADADGKTEEKAPKKKGQGSHNRSQGSHGKQQGNEDKGKKISGKGEACKPPPASQILAKAQASKSFYSGKIHKMKMPSDAGVTMCHSGGCEGQKFFSFTSHRKQIAEAERRARRVFARFDTRRPEGERVAISFAIREIYRSLMQYVKETDITDKPQAGVRSVLDNQVGDVNRWECRTNAQNVTMALFLLKKFCLMKHHDVGPVQMSGAITVHFYGSMVGSNGKNYAVDSFWGRHKWSKGACPFGDSRMPVCIPDTRYRAPNDGQPRRQLASLRERTSQR